MTCTGEKEEEVLIILASCNPGRLASFPSLSRYRVRSLRPVLSAA
jgi:hypothetical protein